MRKHNITLLIVVLVLLTACASAQPDSEATADVAEPGVTPATIYMGFRPDVQFAPFYVGIEKGFFGSEGLLVTTVHESQESTMARLVATGDIPFAVVSGEQVLLGREQGLEIVYFFEWYQQFPVAIASKPEAGIINPTDLAGHSVGVPILSGASYIGLEALLLQAGLTDSDIGLEATGFTQIETLLTDRVDAVVVYASNEPVQLAAQNEPVNIINVTDHVDLVGNGLIVSETTINDNPDLVAALARAFSNAIQYTIDHPDEAFEIAKVYVEGLDDPAIEETQKAVLARSIEMWAAPRPGESDRESWAAMQDILLNIGLLEAAADIDTVFTNEFLP